MTAAKRLKNDNSFSVSKWACYLVPFLFFGGNLLYCLLTGKVTNVNGYYLIHMLYTYDRGFISRGLVGEIISWFTDTVSEDTTRTVMIVFNIMLMICCSLYVGKLLTVVRKDENRFKSVAAILFMFYVLALPINTYYQDFKQDKLVWALSFLSLFLIYNKVGICFVPIICVLQTLINPIFLFTSMVLVSIILLQEFHDSSYKAKNGVICAASYISMIALGLFSLLSEKSVGFADSTEMMEYYFSRYTGALSVDTVEYFKNVWLLDFFTPFEEFLKVGFQVYFVEIGNGARVIAMFIIVALPALIVTTMFWKRAMRKADNKVQKFIFFLCMIAPVVVLPPVLLAWEFAKYVYNFMLVQVGLFMYYVTRNNDAVCGTINDLKEYSKKHMIIPIISACYFVFFIAAYTQ